MSRLDTPGTRKWSRLCTNGHLQLHDVPNHFNNDDHGGGNQNVSKCVWLRPANCAWIPAVDSSFFFFNFFQPCVVLNNTEIFVWLRYYLMLCVLIVFRIIRFIISPTILSLSLSVYTRIFLIFFFGVGGSSTNFSCSCSLQGSDCLQSLSWGRLFRQSSKSVIFKRW